MSLKITVTSPSFSNNELLCRELIKYYPQALINISSIRFSGKDLSRYINDADAVIIGLEKIDENLLSECPNLKFIAKYGVGLDNIDMAACAAHNVKVGWTGGVNKLSVAEMTIAFMLSLSHNIFLTSEQLKRGEWNKQGGSQLSEKTIGIIGVGNIGREVIRILKPFGCQILVNDIIDIASFCRENGMQSVSKKEIFSSVDILSIHTPLTVETRHLINSVTLRLMKHTAFLINTARGGVVCQNDLKQALSESWIQGAALDVYEQEPPADIDFLKLPNLLCTPHIGGNAFEAVVAMGMSAIHHIREHFSK
jgi:D-3-phosphoglycerate dehydrogenase